MSTTTLRLITSNKVRPKRLATAAARQAEIMTAVQHANTVAAREFLAAHLQRNGWFLSNRPALLILGHALERFEEEVYEHCTGGDSMEVGTP